MEFDVSTFIWDRQMMASPTPPAASTSDTPGLVTAALAAKSAAAAVVWLAYVQLGGVYDLKELAAHLRPGK